MTRKAARGVPDVGVVQAGEEVLDGADADERQPGLLRQRLEVGAGEQRDVVAAGLQRLAQGDEGMDVAVAADRHEQDVRHVESTVRSP